ncbi:MAG: hypothetical protein R3300_04590 [Candidatus Promineifilaceae bacterium]|nr:hypothetical protein [Candidatus Promineifilaceae bacterium]
MKEDEPSREPERTERLHQVMDWQAAIWAGLVAGAAMLLILLIAYPVATGGKPWTVFRFIAAILLGRSALIPPSAFNLLVMILGLTIHLVLSVFYATILALIIHRWGIIVGFLGGALFGAALFLINSFGFTTFFDWFYLLRTWPILLLHLFFGAAAGSIYEMLERDYYVEDVAAEWT